jgi:hypothetical protein
LYLAHGVDAMENAESPKRNMSPPPCAKPVAVRALQEAPPVHGGAAFQQGISAIASALGFS